MAQNAIYDELKFKIFLGGMPPDPPSMSCATIAQSPDYCRINPKLLRRPCKHMIMRHTCIVKITNDVPHIEGVSCCKIEPIISYYNLLEVLLLCVHPGA